MHGAVAIQGVCKLQASCNDAAIPTLGFGTLETVGAILRAALSLVLSTANALDIGDCFTWPIESNILMSEIMPFPSQHRRTDINAKGNSLGLYLG